MEFKQILDVLGVKRSKGQLENGQTYDSTKAYVVVPMDTAKGDAVGVSCGEFTIGDSTVFDQWERLKYPCKAEAVMAVVTTGKNTKLTVKTLTPAKV